MGQRIRDRSCLFNSDYSSVTRWEHEENCTSYCIFTFLFRKLGFVVSRWNDCHPSYMKANYILNVALMSFCKLVAMFIVGVASDYLAHMF